jgi:hypothetical protein
VLASQAVDDHRVARLRSLVQLVDGRELAATLLRGEIALGTDRSVLLEELESLRKSFAAAGDEAAGDDVMELMDRLAGWCAPSARI